LKKLCYLTKYIYLKFETLNHYFSESKDLSLDDLAVLAECFRKGFPNKLYLQKLQGKDLRDDCEHVGMTTFRILIGIAWSFIQAKLWRWWQTVLCGDSILSCCLATFTDMSGALKK